MTPDTDGGQSPSKYPPWLADVVSAAISLTIAACFAAYHHPLLAAAFVITAFSGFAKRHGIGTSGGRAVFDLIAFSAFYIWWTLR
ncbi:MAG: hypothetical protein ABUL62_34025 [Myxococcales bacterium]